MINSRIPNNIILIWIGNNNIPDYVFENIKKLNPEKNIFFFTDDTIKLFLLKFYDQKHLDFFNDLKLKKFKADFFRYCYLYKMGGYYMDIDTKNISPISDIVENDTDFFTVLATGDHGAGDGHVSIGLIFSIPNNPIIKKNIDDMFFYGPNLGTDPPDIPPYNGYPVTCFYKNLFDFIGSKPKKGMTRINEMNIQLAEEINPSGRGFFVTYNSKKFAESRYENYRGERGFISKSLSNSIPYVKAMLIQPQPKLQPQPQLQLQPQLQKSNIKLWLFVGLIILIVLILIIKYFV